MQMRVCILILLMSTLAFADSCPSGASDCFYCGEGGPACTRDCQGVWDENLGDYKVCECPQGKPCVCYCSATGYAGPVWIDGSELKEAPECGHLESCDPCAAVIALQGKVFVKRDGGWCSSAVGARVTSGDEIWVPSGSRATLLNKRDGHTDTLKPDTYVTLHAEQDPSASFATHLWTLAKGSIYAFFPPSNEYFGSPEYYAGEYVYDQMVVAGAVDRGGNPDPALLIESDGTTVTYKAVLGDFTLISVGSGEEISVPEGYYIQAPVSGGSHTSAAPFDVQAEERWWEDAGGPDDTSSQCCGTSAILLVLAGAAFCRMD